MNSERLKKISSSYISCSIKNSQILGFFVNKVNCWNVLNWSCIIRWKFWFVVLRLKPIQSDLQAKPVQSNPVQVNSVQSNLDLLQSKPLTISLQRRHCLGSSRARGGGLDWVTTWKNICVGGYVTLWCLDKPNLIESNPNQSGSNPIPFNQIQPKITVLQLDSILKPSVFFFLVVLPKTKIKKQ